MNCRACGGAHKGSLVRWGAAGGEGNSGGKGGGVRGQCGGVAGRGGGTA